MPTAHALEGARRSGGSGDLRHGNLAHILRYVRDHGPCSRHDIANGCGLGVSTLTDLINELRSRRLVRELDPVRRPAAGRPTRPITLDGDPWAVMGVHIAIDAIEVEVATVGGEELWRETATVDLRGLSVEDGYGIIAAVVTEQVQRLDVGRELIAVEVGMGGYVSRERGLVTSAHVFGWEDVSLRERLERTLWEAGVTNPVNVGVANDCQLAALYSGRNEVHLPNDLVAVYLGGLRNLGSGVIIDGEIFGGAHGGAGDLGHVNVAIEGGVCWCGRSSCLQMIVSPQALLTRSGLLPADEAAELVDRRPLEAMALLVDAAEAGNEKVLQTLATAGDTLGTVLDDFLGSINPHAAIIGGYLGMLAPYLMPSLESRLAGRIARPAFATTRVIAVDHFDRRVVRGAVLAARDGVLTEPLTLTRMSA